MVATAATRGPVRLATSTLLPTALRCSSIFGNLRPGDEVLVTRQDGTAATFRVDTVRQDAKDDFPTDLVYGDTDHAALRLITCGGDFDSGERSYRDNIVVFATLVGSEGSRPY